MGAFGRLPAEVATPLAMVLTELVQNAVEHAYPGDGGGPIQVLVRAVSRAAGASRCADEGAGLPPAFDLATSTRLGLQIVRTLVAGELGGELAVENRVPAAPGCGSASR